jgi:group I intron endonuclease
MTKITGIYKITSPVGKIYIGQTRHLLDRFSNHRYAIVANSTRPIVQSLFLYGHEAHSFELIHELPIDVDSETMDIYEQFYIDAYRDCGIELLNLREAGMSAKMHPSTKEYLSKIRIGVPKSEEHKLKISKANKGTRIGKYAGENNPKNKLTKEQVIEIRARHTPNVKRANVLLALEYNVSVSTIERITSKSGKTKTWTILG